MANVFLCIMYFGSSYYAKQITTRDTDSVEERLWHATRTISWKSEWLFYIRTGDMMQREKSSVVKQINFFLQLTCLTTPAQANVHVFYGLEPCQWIDADFSLEYRIQVKVFSFTCSVTEHSWIFLLFTLLATLHLIQSEESYYWVQFLLRRLTL